MRLPRSPAHFPKLSSVRIHFQLSKVSEGSAIFPKTRGCSRQSPDEVRTQQSCEQEGARSSPSTLFSLLGGRAFASPANDGNAAPDSGRGAEQAGLSTHRRSHPDQHQEPEAPRGIGLAGSRLGENRPRRRLSLGSQPGRFCFSER